MGLGDRESGKRVRGCGEAIGVYIFREKDWRIGRNDAAKTAPQRCQMLVVSVGRGCPLCDTWGRRGPAGVSPWAGVSVVVHVEVWVPGSLGGMSCFV